eukprot:COSAG01_NODE_138_length_24329_cov_45.428229_17_plen_54_part_00
MDSQEQGHLAEAKEASHGGSVLVDDIAYARGLIESQAFANEAEARVARVTYSY